MIGTERDKASKLHTALREGSKSFRYGFLFGMRGKRAGEIISTIIRAARAVDSSYRGPTTNGAQALHRFEAATPGLKQLRESLEAQAAWRAWVLGLDGRRVPTGAQYKALNRIVTSAEAIICKRWLINVYDELRSRFHYGWDGDVVITAWIHDELVACCRPAIAKEIGEIMVRHAREAGGFFELKVPLDADYTIGTSWAGEKQETDNAKHLDDERRPSTDDLRHDDGPHTELHRTDMPPLSLASKISERNGARASRSTVTPGDSDGVRVITALRRRLLKTGFNPLPIVGKRPVIEGWQKQTNTSINDIKHWNKLYPAAINTGILTARTPALDIDILKTTAANAVETLVRERCGSNGRLVVRFGREPKRCIPFRSDTPFPKIVANLIPPGGGDTEKIEFLADGQQFVVAGIHPDTKQPYHWLGGELGAIKRDDLPDISAAKAKTLVDDIAALLIGKYGYTAKAAKAKDNAQTGNGATEWADFLANPIDHDALTAFAMSLVKSGMDDGAVVNLLHALVDGADGDADRKQRRHNEISDMVSSARAKCSAQTIQSTFKLNFIDMSRWDFEPTPEQEWAVYNRIPRRECVLFSGEGGSGKSIEQLHLSVVSTIGREWLGVVPEQGPAIFIDAEDDEKVLHRRTKAIGMHYDISITEMIEAGLHLVSWHGHDAALAVVARNGKIEPTPLYQQLLEAAGYIKPVLIGIAASANVFAGNENDRAQVQQFIGLLTRVAMAANGSIVLISHPSLAGINTETGLSGTTQWHNSVRARYFMRNVKPQDGEPLDTDLREIVFKKNNYGSISESIQLRWNNGLFLPVSDVVVDQAAKEAAAQDVFLTLLKRFRGQNRYVGDKPGTSYAPALFAHEEEVTSARLTKKDLERAMRLLFQRNAIENEAYGRRPSYRIIPKI